MSTRTIHCTVLTGQQGDASRPWPRYRKISPWSDPLIAKLLVKRIGDQEMGIVTAKETRPEKASTPASRFSQSTCELPPPLDDAAIGVWRVVPRHGVKPDDDISSVPSHGTDDTVEDRVEGDSE